MVPRNSAVCTSESSSAVEKIPGSIQNAAAAAFAAIFGPFWLRFVDNDGVVGVGLGLRPCLDPNRKQNTRAAYQSNYPSSQNVILIGAPRDCCQGLAEFSSWYFLALARTQPVGASKDRVIYAPDSSNKEGLEPFQLKVPFGKKREDSRHFSSWCPWDRLLQHE